ncbi:MAG: FadR family transcriptional regulator [Actinobacteria bacterium]|nr:FadR family transcriptional regulator [Actinomycetota bacterium]
MADQIFGRIAGQILSEELRPGDNLPSERTLAERYGVNRHVVREAVKRLQQAGLVRVVQGGGTRVLNPREQCGLDLLELVARYVEPKESLAGHWVAVMELRVALGAEIARLCALRAPREIRMKMPGIVRLMREARSDDAIYRLYARLWGLIADGSENLAYRLTFNTLVRLSSTMGDLSVAWFAEEARQADYMSDLVAAIVMGESDNAERRARDILQGTLDRYNDLIENSSELVAEP